MIEIVSELGKRVRVSDARWNFIVEVKHRVMKGREEDVKLAIAEPEEVRKSVKDGNVFLYYRRFGGRHVCAVVKHLNGEGFLITAYLTDKIKVGELVWKR